MREASGAHPENVCCADSAAFDAAVARCAATVTKREAERRRTMEAHDLEWLKQLRRASEEVLGSLGTLEEEPAADVGVTGSPIVGKKARTEGGRAAKRFGWQRRPARQQGAQVVL